MVIVSLHTAIGHYLRQILTKKVEINLGGWDYSSVVVYIHIWCLNFGPGHNKREKRNGGGGGRFDKAKKNNLTQVGKTLADCYKHQSYYKVSSLSTSSKRCIIYQVSSEIYGISLKLSGHARSCFRICLRFFLHLNWVWIRHSYLGNEHQGIKSLQKVLFLTTCICLHLYGVHMDAGAHGNQKRSWGNPWVGATGCRQ